MEFGVIKGQGLEDGWKKVVHDIGHVGNSKEIVKTVKT